MDIEDQILCLMIIYWYLKRRSSRRIPRIMDNTSALSGHAYTLELLNGSNTQCRELMSLSRDAYVRLCEYFKEKQWVHNSSHITVEEKMAIFLTIIGHNERFRIIKRRFQHSTRTIHRYFHEVLNGMIEFSKEIIVPTSFDPKPDIPRNYKNLRKIFSSAVGVLDGTLVHAVVPVDQQTRYRRRGRWEGIALDSRVLKEVAFDPSSDFPFPPPDKYYLCDAAYTNTRGFLSPYRNTRYWLADFRCRSALNKEEKFNHAHAQLINVIERAYGVLKVRFPILKRMTPYPFTIQRDIVIACFAVHNFIRKHNIEDELFAQYDRDNMFDDDGEQNEGNEEEVQDEPQWGDQDIEFIVNLREHIAIQLLTTV